MIRNKKLTVVNEALQNKSRRRTVKNIVGGVVALATYNLLPAKWGSPIIESIFLPAHAQTSGEAAETPPPETPTPTPSNRYFVDDTNGDGHYHLLIVDPDSNTGNITHVNNRLWVRREGVISFTVGGIAQLAITGVGGNACTISPPTPADHAIEITDISASSVTYNFTHGIAPPGPHHTGWVFNEIGSMPTVPNLLPCSSPP